MKFSKSFREREVKRRFFALPKGLYPSVLLDGVQCSSWDEVKVSDDGKITVVQVDEPKENALFTEATPQAVFVAQITVGRYAGRKMVERMPLQGYVKANGENDEEMIAAGHKIVEGYFVDEEGNRIISNEGTDVCLDRFESIFAAILNGEEGTIEDVMEMDDEDRKLNILVTQEKKPKGGITNAWRAFYGYKEDVVSDDEASDAPAEKKSEAKVEDDY